MTLDEFRRNNAQTIRTIAAKHGVISLRVFGSFARDEATEQSDLDLLIEAGPATTPWFPGGLVADLEVELGRKVDIVEQRSLNPLIRDRVLSEAVPL